MCRKRCTARSRRRNGRCEFFARLLSQRRVSYRLATPKSRQRGAVGAYLVGDDLFGAPEAPHRFLQEFKGCLLGPRLGAHLTLMIDRSPQVVAFTVDPHENLVQVPTPLWPCAQSVRSVFCGFRRRVSDQIVATRTARTRGSHRYLVRASQVLHVPQRERKPDVKHHRRTDDLGAGLEVLERVALCHAGRVGPRTIGHRSGCFDVAPNNKHAPVN